MMDDGTQTAWQDFMMLLLLGFVLVIVLLIPHINPPGKVDESSKEPPGQLLVEAHWADGLNADVDLWVKSPGGRPVGYSNKNGLVFDLLRDDLGTTRDLTNRNYEIATTRGLPEGEYQVNLHCFRCVGFPVVVLVVISQKVIHGGVNQILSKTVNLKSHAQEMTVFRFRINKNGNLVAGSVHDLPKSLRSAAR